MGMAGIAHHVEVEMTVEAEHVRFRGQRSCANSPDWRALRPARDEGLQDLETCVIADPESGCVIWRRETGFNDAERATSQGECQE